ncbi:MAG: sensor histidine kinase [Candidatus Hydrogenedentes bacterium]|nr:sensor histidine kinase [Candidatus Hydrogenedentota bacterium]
MNQHKSAAVARGRAAKRPIWQWRIAILVIMSGAFSLELMARYMNTSGLVSHATPKFISMGALLLLSVAAWRLILMLEGKTALKAAVVLATGVLVLAQTLSILREFSFWRTGHELIVAWSIKSESNLFLAGTVLLLSTYYFALLESIWTEAEFRRSQGKLESEISERRRAQAELRESHDELRRLTAHVETLREDERARVARELHDQLGQDLVCLRMDLCNVQRCLQDGQDGAASSLELIRSMLEHTDRMTTTTRRLISELRPTVLDDLELPAAIAWLAADFETRTQIPCAVDVSPGSARFNRDVTSALFRIVQECLTNVIRHSGASQVNVRLNANNGHTRLEVEDNGCGFPATQGRAGQKSFGILGIRERVALLGGTFRIQSQSGAGTCVSVTVPCSSGTGEAIDARA